MPAVSDAGMVGLAPKWVRLALKWDKSGAFSDQISVHLAQGSADIAGRGHFILL